MCTQIHKYTDIHRYTDKHRYTQIYTGTQILFWSGIDPQVTDVFLKYKERRRSKNANTLIIKYEMHTHYTNQSKNTNINTKHIT